MSNEFDNDKESIIDEESKNTIEHNINPSQEESSIYSMTKDDIKYHLWEESASNSYNQDKNNNMDTEETHKEDQVSAQSLEHTDPYGMKQESSLNNNASYIKKKPKNKMIRKFALLVGAAAVFGIVAGVSFQGVSYLADQLNPKSKETIIGNNGVTGTNVDQITEENQITATQVAGGLEGDNDVSDVVANTMPSIVSITSTVTQSYSDFFGNQYDQDAQGSGSGIIVGKNDDELLIVTNNHVITDSKAIKVTFINNDVLNAQIKGTDQTADLAVVAVQLKSIKKETMDAIKVATLGNSDKVKVGQMSIAIGNALGYGQSVTVGYISAKDREVSVDNNSMTLLQTDAAINPGNSGGALLNVNGEVIGINSVKYASNEVEGMGYAIPISKATPIINELMNRKVVKTGEEGYLGIMGQDVTKEIASMYNMPIGAYVVETVKEGPATKAGILSGDIITAINGIEANSMRSVKEIVTSYPAGTKVTVTIQRRNGANYEEKVIDVTLEKMDPSLKKKSNSTIEQEDKQTTVPFGYEFLPQN